MINEKLPFALAWKFNNQTGMRCQEIDGVMTIIEFPGGIPSLEDQALWMSEYEAWLLAGGEKDLAANPSNADRYLKALILALNNGSFVPGSNYTITQIKNIIRATINGG